MNTEDEIYKLGAEQSDLLLGNDYCGVIFDSESIWKHFCSDYDCGFNQTKEECEKACVFIADELNRVLEFLNKRGERWNKNLLRK